MLVKPLGADFHGFVAAHVGAEMPVVGPVGGRHDVDGLTDIDAGGVLVDAAAGGQLSLEGHDIALHGNR